MYEDRVKWIEYKGKRVLQLNYANMQLSELPGIFDYVTKTASKEPLNSVSYLTDVTNINFSLKVLGLFNQQAEKTKPYDKGVAIIGVTGLVKVMYDGYSKLFSKAIKSFNNKEDALEWLVKLP